MALFGTLGLGAVVTMKDRASRQMDRLNQSFVRMHKTADRSLKGVEEQMEKLDKRMDRSRSRLGKSLKVMGAGMIMAVPLGMAGKAAATFEDSMNDVLSVVLGTGVAEEEARQLVAELGDEILAFAGKTRIPLAQVAASAYELTSALGIEVAKSAFQSAANQAVAGKGTINESTRVMTATLANFGRRWGSEMTEVEKAEKVFNVVSGTIAAFNTDLSRLSAGMAYATPSANLLNMEFAEMTATLGMLQTKGLESSMAGTAFAAGIRGLTQMTMKFGDEAERAKVEAMSMEDYLSEYEAQRKTGKASKAVRAAGKLGQLEITDDAGRLLPLWRIVQNIEKVFGITAEKAAEAKEQIEAGGLEGADAFQVLGLSMKDATAMQAAFRDEGSRMFSLLLGQSDALREYTEEINNSDMGLKMLGARQSGALAKWDMTKNALKSTAIMFGQKLLPTIDSVINSLGTLVERVQSFMKVHPTATKWIAWGGGVFSILMIVGGAIGSVVFAMRIWRTQAAMMQLAGLKTGLSFKALANSALILRARLLALAAAEKVLAGAKIFLATVTKIVTAVMGFFNLVLMSTPIGWLVLGITAVIAIIYALIFHFDWVKKIAATAWGGIVKGLKWTWNLLKSFGRFFEKLWDKFGWIVKSSPAYIAIKGLIDGVKWMLEAMGLLNNKPMGPRTPLLDREMGAPKHIPVGGVLPASMLPEDIKPESAREPSEKLSDEDFWKIKTAAPPEGKAPPPSIITHNTFKINATKMDEKELARQVTKRQIQHELKTAQGQN